MSVVAVGAIVLLLGAAQSAVAQQNGTPGDTLQTALPVKTDQTYSGTLEAAGVVHVYATEPL